MGRFHYHADGTGHSHDDGDHDHDHDHDHHDGGNGVGDHSGYQTGTLRVDVLEKILGENDRTADANRSDFYDADVQVINLMSSPGAGKTTLLREVLLRLGPSLRVGIVEGDVETSLDADRLAGLGAPVSLVNTANGFGGECHLD
ncbi:MAG TPA: GTP-binding protein, partial [Ilumatobacteraceae bacterium]